MPGRASNPHLRAAAARDLSKRTRIMQLVAEGKFPKPIKLSSRRLVWRARDVLAWIEQQSAKAA